MSVLESTIEKRTCQRAFKELSIQGDKFNIIGRRGYPDRIFWIPGGKPLLIEFKRPGEKLRRNQVHIHNWLKKLGYQVEVHDDVELAFQAITKAVEATQVSKKGA